VSRGRYIALAGNIGAGKSSFLAFLERHHDFRAVREPNDDNPFLDRFYADMQRWSFHSQTWFLASKIALHRSFADEPRQIVQDRTVWEDAEIFAAYHARRGWMSREEAATYTLLYEGIRDGLRAPDVLVYLRCPVRTLRRRIQARGREMERSVPPAYLRALHELYEDWYERWDLSPKVVFETDRFDPVTDIVDCQAAVELLRPWLQA
jgi:deoxyadenosine/deoxycytidine kinase